MQTATKQLWASAMAAIAGSLCTATLAVENMTCGTCPIVVKKALERVRESALRAWILIKRPPP